MSRAQLEDVRGQELLDEGDPSAVAQDSHGLQDDEDAERRNHAGQRRGPPQLSHHEEVRQGAENGRHRDPGDHG